MKHLISEYYKPDDAMQQKDFENILRTHSLNRLMKFLKANMGAEFSKNTQTHMRMIDGFYFSTRYPGDDSIEIDGDDVETCNDAIELCRTEVLELEQKLKRVRHSEIIYKSGDSAGILWNAGTDCMALRKRRDRIRGNPDLYHCNDGFFRTGGGTVSLSNNLNQTLASGERVLSLLEETPMVEEISGNVDIRNQKNSPEKENIF